MAAVLAWLVKVSVAVVKWSVANPLKAVAVAAGLALTGSYVKKQPWAGATLVGDMLYGAAKLYGWPAALVLVGKQVDVLLRSAADYLVGLLRGQGGGPTPWDWLIPGIKTGRAGAARAVSPR